MIEHDGVSRARLETAQLHVGRSSKDACCHVEHERPIAKEPQCAARVLVVQVYADALHAAVVRIRHELSVVVRAKMAAGVVLEHAKTGHIAAGRHSPIMRQPE